MGNNVTTTPVQTLKIDANNDEDIEVNDNNVRYNSNAINATNYNGFDVQTQSQQYQEHYSDENWNQFGQQYVESNQTKEQSPHESDSFANERVHHIEDHDFNDSVPDFNDESTDVLNDMLDSKPINDFNTGFKVQTPQTQPLGRSIPLLKRSVDDNDIQEIDDLESIDSSSKLTLNDVKSDTEEVIQELNKLDLDLDEPTDRYGLNYRKRGQSWSNWENNVHQDLKAESSLSSFSRPASINTSIADNQTPVSAFKTKSYTAPESRVRADSAIEWLAKQHGLEIGSSLDHETKKKTNDRTINRNDLRITSFEIPGSIASVPTTPAVNENNDKYDDLEKQIIDSIENDFIR